MSGLQIARLGLRALAIAAVIIPDALSAKDAPAHLYGPPPEWAHFVEIAEPVLQAQMIDPESARLTWTGGYFKGTFKPFLSGRIEGYVGCGHINARNRLGGYAGATAFVVVIDYDRVLYSQIADPGLDGVSIQCTDAMNRGMIPPVPTRVAAASLAPQARAQDEPISGQTVSGLTLRVMPDGAYVSAVADNSAAAQAGLKRGMVVTAINGIPLSGMGDAMLKVAAAAGPTASLTIVGGTTIKPGAAK